MGNCMLCDKSKPKEDLIEGISGHLCKDCFNIMQGIENNNKLLIDNRDSSIIEELNLIEIKNEVDKLVFGQEEAKKQLITELYKHIEFKDNKANNIFLVGNSGVGKTHLVRTLANIMDLPFLEVDATTFTETGYKGSDVTEILDRLLIKESGNAERVEKSIVFIDEIDKTTTTMNQSASSSKVQEALLKIIEGTEYHYNLSTDSGKLQGSIDTSKIMFIAAGACVGLNEIRDTRLNPNKSNIGFSTTSEVGDVSDNNYIAEDLIDFGFIPEFVGRYSLIIELEALSKADIKSILKHSPESVIYKNTKAFSRRGIELIVSEEDIDFIVEKVYNNPLGIRGISQFLTKHLNNSLYDALLSNKKSIELKLTRQINTEKEMEIY